jgi:hypothetical protein
MFVLNERELLELEELQCRTGCKKYQQITISRKYLLDHVIYFINIFVMYFCFLLVSNLQAWQVFSIFTKTASSNSGILSRSIFESSFLRFLRLAGVEEEHGQLECSMVLNRLFDLFDHQRNGNVDIREVNKK